MTHSANLTPFLAAGICRAWTPPTRLRARNPARPGVNYARGDLIVVTMKEGSERGVDRVDIRGKVDGIQLEPTAETAALPDSAQ